MVYFEISESTMHERLRKRAGGLVRASQASMLADFSCAHLLAVVNYFSEKGKVLKVVVVVNIELVLTNYNSRIISKLAL